MTKCEICEVARDGIEDGVCTRPSCMRARVHALAEESAALKAQLTSIGITPYLARMREIADRYDRAVMGICVALDAFDAIMDYWTMTGFAECDPECDCIVQRTNAVMATITPLVPVGVRPVKP